MPTLYTNLQLLGPKTNGLYKSAGGASSFCLLPGHTDDISEGAFNLGFLTQIFSSPVHAGSELPSLSGSNVRPEKEQISFLPKDKALSRFP